MCVLNRTAGRRSDIVYNGTPLIGTPKRAYMCIIHISGKLINPHIITDDQRVRINEVPLYSSLEVAK